MYRRQEFGLAAAVFWGVLGSIGFGALTLYVRQDIAAAMTVAVACPFVTVFLYLVFERLVAG
jgi:hypothetical protein